MMDAEVATRRLTVLHSHVLGLNRQECCASDVAMQVRGLRLQPVKLYTSAVRCESTRSSVHCSPARHPVPLATQGQRHVPCRTDGSASPR